jgi:arginase family enzyme
MRVIKIPLVDLEKRKKAFTSNKNALREKSIEKEEREASNAILKDLKANYEDFSRINLEEIHLNNFDLKVSERLIYGNAVKEFEVQDKTFFVGGDNLMCLSLGMAFSSYFGFGKSFFIVFDARLPLWVVELVEKNKIFSKDIILVGTRALNDKEKEWIKKNDIKLFSEIAFGLNDIADIITEKANLGKKSVYMSLNMDVFEPCFVPGLMREDKISAGLMPKDFFYLIRRIFRLVGLKAIDINGISLKKDSCYDFITIKLASRILKEFLESYYRQ